MSDRPRGRFSAASGDLRRGKLERASSPQPSPPEEEREQTAASRLGIVQVLSWAFAGGQPRQSIPPEFGFRSEIYRVIDQRKTTVHGHRSLGAVSYFSFGWIYHINALGCQSHQLPPAMLSERNVQLRTGQGNGPHEFHCLRIKHEQLV